MGSAIACRAIWQVNSLNEKYGGGDTYDEGGVSNVTHYGDGSDLTWRYVDGTVLTLPDGDGAGLKWTDATNCMQQEVGEVGEGWGKGGGRYMTWPTKYALKKDGNL